MEIANRSWDSNDVPADRGRPSTEALWDQALTAGANVFGTATDDAHHYFDAAAAGARGEPVFPGGLGFVMVRAAKQPGAIRDALARGDFYASTGVLLARVAQWAVALWRNSRSRSTRAPRARTASRSSAQAGGCSRAAEDAAPAFVCSTRVGGYVRVVVEDPRGGRAWVQPVRVPR